MGNSNSIPEAIHSIPEDTIACILSRLDYDDLLRLKSVCKHFQSVISIPNTSNLLFVHVKDCFDHIGKMRGYDQCGELRVTFNSRSLFPCGISSSESPCFLVASGGMFLFMILSTRVMLVVNPIKHTFQRMLWMFETPDAYSIKNHLKFIVTSCDHEIEFKIIYAEYTKLEPFHFVSNSSRNGWSCLGKRTLIDYTLIDRSDESSIFLLHNNVFMISFFEAKCDNLPNTFYETLSNFRLLNANAPEPGWTDNWEEHYFQKWLILINNVTNIKDPSFQALKSVSLFKLRNDLTKFEYVSQIPEHMIKRLETCLFAQFTSVFFDADELEDMAHVCFMNAFENEEFRLYRFTYDISRRKWTASPHIALARVLGVGFMRRLRCMETRPVEEPDFAHEILGRINLLVTSSNFYKYAIYVALARGVHWFLTRKK